MIKRWLCILLVAAFLCAFPMAACSDPAETTPPDGDTEIPAPPEEEQPEYIDGREVLSAETVNAFDGEGVRLFGRTYINANNLVLENAATGAEVSFYGTSLSADIISASSTMYCRVFVDGDTEGTRLRITRNNTYTLAENLQEGIHTVRIVKATSSQNGNVKIDSFSTDGKFLRPEQADNLRIEFVGDSITVGAGVFADSAQGCNADNSDATKGFAYLTAQALGADCSIVATEGICVGGKSALSVNMLEMYESISSISLGKYPAETPYDIVVVGLGTNDNWYMMGNAEYTVDRFAEDYQSLLGLIRGRNPDAVIVCVYGMMGVSQNIVTGITQAIENMGDSRIFSCQLPTNLQGADSHPSAEGAIEQSAVLTEYLQELIA